MSIETLDDIVDELANLLGIYDDRCEWESNLKSRIREAIRVEQALEKYYISSVSPYDLSNPNHPAHKARR